MRGRKAGSWVKVTGKGVWACPAGSMQPKHPALVEHVLSSHTSCGGACSVQQRRPEGGMP
eukprot:293844-Chlamydomonas_euryale.AAC.1